MAKLKDFPQAKDLAVAKPDWENACVGVTRDSEALTRANFDALCDQFDDLDPYGNDWEVVRFKHWAVGWVEEIFMKPGTKVHTRNAEVKERMAKYPCIDEGLWIEYDEAENAVKVGAKNA